NASTSKPLPASASLKERLFAEQRQKYQARYNDSVDEVTNASVQLSQMEGTIRGIQGNLNLLAKAVYSRVQTLLKEKHGDSGKLILGAMMFKPVYRFFRRSGTLLKLGVIVVAFFVIQQALKLITAGEIPAVVIPYALAATAF